MNDATTTLMIEKIIQKRFGGDANGMRSIGRIGRRNKGKRSSIDRKVISAIGNMMPLKDMMEVNIFMNNGNCIHITEPKISVSQASLCIHVKGDINLLSYYHYY